MKNLIIYLFVLLMSTTSVLANNNTILAEVVRKEIAIPVEKTTQLTKKELRKQRRLERKRIRKEKRAKIQWGAKETNKGQKSDISNPFLDIGLASLAVTFGAPAVNVLIVQSLFYTIGYGSFMLLSNIFGILGLVAMIAAIVFSIIGFTKLKKTREKPDGFDFNLMFGIISVILSIAAFILMLGGGFFFGLGWIFVLLGAFIASIFGIFFNKRQIQKRPRASRIQPTMND